MRNCVKILLSLFGALGLVTMCVAQTPQATSKTAKGADDPQAHAQLSKTAKWLASMPAVEVRFNACAATMQTVNHPTGCQRGSMLVKGESFRLVLGSQTYYCNGTDLWLYDPAGKEASVYTYDGSNIQINPVALLKDYKSHYRAKYIRQETRAGQPANIIDLTPLEPNEILKVRLYLNASNNRPVRMELYFAQDNIYVYDISSCQSASGVDSADFGFDPSQYPGITVNDMR